MYTNYCAMYFVSKFCFVSRLSNNSRAEPSFLETNDSPTNKDSSRVNTPANFSSPKPSFAPSTSDIPNQNDRMVSPKRKVEHFPHLYVANNVKTSTFNEQIEKSNLSTKNNFNNSNDFKYNCSHSSINMVPERDTGPNKISARNVNAVSNLRLLQSQGSSGYGGEFRSGEEQRMVSSRQHHHVSIQELRQQVRLLLCFLTDYCLL